jgi:hypothetical protein
MNDKNKNSGPGMKLPPGIMSYLIVAILATLLINTFLSVMNIMERFYL